MSTIYSIGAEDDDEITIREKLRQEINPDTGKPMYTLALGLLSYGVLRFRDAMHEYIGHSLQRDERLEMAYNSNDLYDCSSLSLRLG